MESSIVTSWPAIGTAVAFLLYYVISTFVSWHRLRHFEGPFIASVSYLWLAWTNLTGSAWKVHTRVRQRYRGSLIRIGPNLLMTDDPDTIRRMSSARSRYGRGGWYEAFRIDSANPSMFGTCDTQWHDEIKAKASFGYSGREIPTLERDVDGQIANLKKYIRTRYLSGPAGTKPMDFASASQYFALDTISTVAFGKEFGFLEADADIHGYVHAMDIFSPAATLISDVPWIRSLFLNNWLFSLIGPKHTDEKGPGKILGLAKEAVDRRFESGLKEKQDMLGSFLRHGITRHQCEAEGTLQIIAGTDMTSNVIRTTMLFAASSPKVYRRLQEEIDSAIASGRASNPVTYAEAKALPYLMAVIYEGIRIHPPNFSLLNKRVPPEGDTIDGKFVPGGTEIAQNLWSILRREAIFGKDVDVFRPERYLESGDAAKKSEMERTTELQFGYGRWMCAGKHIAFLEITKVIFELFRDFDFQVINVTQPWSAKQYSVFIIKEMMMRVTEREGAGKAK